VNELAGVQHMKLYLFDTNLLISGANLADNYFSNRQDRYYRFVDNEKLANYCCSLIEAVSSFSFKMDQYGILHLEKDSADPMGPLEPFKEFVQSKINPLFSGSNDRIESHMSYFSSTASNEETLIFPTIQLGFCNIRNDERMTTQLIHASTQQDFQSSKLFISSPYLNLIRSYRTLITTSKTTVDILTASPQTNGFFDAKDLSRIIPSAYSALEYDFMKELNKTALYGEHKEGSKVRILEYVRPNWTFHAKGIWIGDEQPFLTTIGSANLGKLLSFNLLVYCCYIYRLGLHIDR